MSNKIGIDLEAVSKQLEDSLKVIKQLAKDTDNSLNQMNTNFQEQTKKSANEMKKTSSELDKLKNGLKNFGQNSPNSQNSFWNVHNRYGSGLSMFQNSLINGFGHALNGNFGSAGSAIIGGGFEAWGMSTGNPMAIAVSKTVGKLFDFIGRKVDEATERAEQNMIRTTYLHSSIGGFSSSGYNSLLGNIYSASEQIGRMTNAETIQLFQTVAKASGTSDQAQLSADSIYAGQFGKAFGVDVNASGRFFGGLRATGTATTEAMMKRFGTIIGEALGKTGAFAKADELMTAVGNFATSAERTTLRGNSQETERFTSLLADMASGKDKDLQGFTQLIQKADQAYRSGSGGEAGWAARLASYQRAYGSSFSGLDLPYLMEGGLFASINSVFGNGSNVRIGESPAERIRRNQLLANARRRGTLNTTNAETILKYIRSQVGNNRTLIDDAFSRITGTNVTQAHELINGIESTGRSGGFINALSKYGLSDLSPEKLQRITPLLGYNKDKLLENAEKLKSGDGMIDSLSEDEVKELDDAIAKGDKEEIRKVEIRLTKNHEWEERQGQLMEEHIKSIDNKLEESIGAPLATIRDDVRGILDWLMNEHGTGNGEGSSVDPETGERTITLPDGTEIKQSGGAKFGNTEGDYQTFIKAVSGAEAGGSSVWKEADWNSGLMRANGAPQSQIGKTKWHYNSSDKTTDWGRYQLNDGGTLQKALKMIGVDPKLASDTNWKLNNPGIIDKAGEAYMRDSFAYGLKAYGGDAMLMFAHHHLPAVVDKAYKKYGKDWAKHPEFTFGGYSLGIAINSARNKLKQLGSGWDQTDEISHDEKQPDGTIKRVERNDFGDRPAESQDDWDIYDYRDHMTDAYKYMSYNDGLDSGIMSSSPLNVRVYGYLYDGSGHQVGEIRQATLDGRPNRSNAIYRT